MKNYISHLYIVIMALVMMACQSEDANATAPSETNSTNGENKTLIVYYSYTNNTEQIVDDLKTMINADVIEVEPANKNLDYSANNYAIGTEQLNKIKNNPNDASSYPAIDPVTVDMSKYNTVIIATPLWWSQMASNMQTFLFKYGNEMAGKNIGLIVSSHSSGISSVEADAKRLVPNGKFYAKSLWINASKHSQRKALLEQWLKDVDFNTTGVASISANQTKSNSIYALNGQKLAEVPAKGMYIEDGVKKLTQLLPFELFSKKFCLNISELGLEIV